MAMPTKDEVRSRFWELKALVDGAKAKIVPLRAAHDAFVNEFNNPAREAELFAPIQALGEDIDGAGLSLFDAEQEMAMCARFLGNVVGEAG